MPGQQRVCAKPLSGRGFYLDLPSNRRAQALENDITLLGGVRHSHCCQISIITVYLQAFSLEFLISNVSFWKQFVYSKQMKLLLMLIVFVVVLVLGELKRAFVRE